MLLFVDEDYLTEDRQDKSFIWDMLHHLDIPYWHKPLSHLKSDERAFFLVSGEFRPDWQEEWFHRQDLGPFFLKQCSPEMLTSIRGGRVKVLVDVTNAPSKPERIYGMQSEFTAFRIHSYDVMLWTSNFMEDHAWCDFSVYPLWMDYQRAVVLQEAHTAPERVSLNAFHPQPRPHKHLYQNANPYPYRLALLLKLIALGIADQGLWSLNNNADQGYAYEDSYHRLMCLHGAADEWWPIDNPMLDAITRLWKAGPVTIDDYPWADSRPCYITSQLYRDSYFSIISETWYKTPRIGVLSEKPARSIIQHHPFVLLSAPGSLQALRDMGYQTFHPYIDESYDLEPDDHKRMSMVVDSISKLCEMSLAELHQWYHGGLLMRIAHNYERLMDRSQSPLHAMTKRLQDMLGR